MFLAIHGGRLMRHALLVGIAVALAGCASHNWTPGPNVAPGLTFDQQKARCSLMARHGGSGFAVAGDPNFVAGAAIGHGISEGVRTQQDFNDCMLASGWVIDDRKATAQPANAAQPASQECRTLSDTRVWLPPCT
jgi:hypothetical protein